jgi:hypothetical protein
MQSMTVWSHRSSRHDAIASASPPRRAPSWFFAGIAP